ncbi:GNAT family N-acetyltransferase [Nubsella zeaxanthinifaciens]|uniref:GNAT family N-acetyltransferase n=1 Tax=Nubsella zeaxanthinifaciens TaxID=392412 RepID=UPI00351FAD31
MMNRRTFEMVPFLFYNLPNPSYIYCLLFTMEITQHNEDRKGSFKAAIDGEQAGMMTYTWAGSTKFIIDHTEVNPTFKGKGVGQQLVMKAVEFARANNLKIMPLCTFAKSVFDKNPDIADVLF